MNVPSSTWERPSTSAALGRAGRDAAAVRRAAAGVAGRDGRLRPGAARMRTAGPDVVSRDRARVGPARRPIRRDRSGTATSAARSASCGAPATFPDRARSSRPTCRPRPPGVLRGLHLHRRQLDLWIVAGRSRLRRPRRRPARCSTGPARRAVVETRELASRRLGPHPDRGRPRLPRPRAARPHLPRDQRVRRLGRARVRVGRPGRRRSPGRRSHETPDGRPILSGSRPRESVPGGAGGAPARRRRLTPTAPLPPAPHRRRPEGASDARDHPAIERGRARRARLTRHAFRSVQPRSPPLRKTAVVARPRSSSPALGDRRRPRSRAATRRPEGRDHRRGDARRDGRLPRPTPIGPTPRRIKYTPNVVKVYSPNATWAKVKAAVVGASVVIYMGHGNGWPSPYTYDPKYTTKDGFGLNATAGAGDYNNKYYGEPYVSTLDLAPGAIVLLHHLCYASGNSEPGNAEPTSRSPASGSTTTPRASSRPAPPRSSPTATAARSATSGRCSRPTSRSRTCGGQRAERQRPRRAFPSARTPGATVYQDPNTPTLGLLPLADDPYARGHDRRGRVGAATATPASTRPASSSPGTPRSRPMARASTANLDTTAPPQATLPAGTRLRVVDAAVPTTAGGGAARRGRGSRRPGDRRVHRWPRMSCRATAPPPIVRVVDVGVGALLTRTATVAVDTADLRGRFSESVDWTVRIMDGADTSCSRADRDRRDVRGRLGRHRRRSRRVRRELHGGRRRAWTPGATRRARTTRTVTVDTAPTLTGLTPDPIDQPWFSPNGDGVRDTVALTATNAEAGSLAGRVHDARRGPRRLVDRRERQRPRGGDLGRSDARPAPRARRRLRDQRRPASTRRATPAKPSSDRSP